MCSLLYYTVLYCTILYYAVRAWADVSTISSTDCTALLLHYSRVHLYFLNLVIGFRDDAENDILATFPAPLMIDDNYGLSWLCPSRRPRLPNYMKVTEILPFLYTSSGYSLIPKNNGYCVGSGCVPKAIWYAMSGPVKRTTCIPSCYRISFDQMVFLIGCLTSTKILSKRIYGYYSLNFIHVSFL